MDIKTRKKLVGLYQSHRKTIKLVAFLATGIAVSFSPIPNGSALLGGFVLLAAYAIFVK